MAIFLRRERWTEQPPGPVEIDPTHPLGQYAVAALTGAMVGSHDACGNAIGFTGTGIYQVSRSSGRFLGHTGANSSVIFWSDKAVGNFGTDDFLVFAQFARLVASTNGVAIGKGDTGANEWMMGGHTAADAFRFYGAAGAIAPGSAGGIVSLDVTRSYGTFRTGASCSSFVDGAVLSTDTSASNSLIDSAHHMTLFSGDYDGTTYDNGRIYPIELAHVVVLRGIGGIDVARALTDEPYAIYKPRTLRRHFLPSGPTAPTYNDTISESATLADSTAAANLLSTLLAETVALADGVTAGATFAQTLIEAVTTADSASALMAFSSTVSETVSLLDQLNTGNVFNEIHAAAVTPADSLASAAAFSATLAESTTPSDATTAAAAFAVSLAEAVTLLDTSSNGSLYNEVLTASVALSDVLTSTATLTGAVVESAALSDALTALAAFQAALTETVTAGDFVATQADQTTLPRKVLTARITALSFAARVEADAFGARVSARNDT